MVTVLGGTVFTILGFVGTALFGQVGTFAIAVVGIVVSGMLWKQTVKTNAIG
jgi:hypothetical protein